MNVTVDQLLARIGAKDVEIMLLTAELAKVKADYAERSQADAEAIEQLKRDLDLERSYSAGACREREYP